MAVLPLARLCLSEKKSAASERRRRFSGWDIDRLALGSPATETLLEAIDTTTGIQDLLLAGVERVALRTNINVNIFAHSRARLDHIATTTGGRNVLIFRVYIVFHCSAP
jgi:hypothetical protein